MIAYRSTLSTRLKEPPFSGHLAAGFQDNSVADLAAGQGKQDCHQRNGHQRVSPNISRRVSPVDMDRMAQQSSDGDRRYGKRHNVPKARIKAFLKIRFLHIV